MRGKLIPARPRGKIGASTSAAARRIIVAQYRSPQSPASSGHAVIGDVSDEA
jgi:hypothetical protein